jgi:general secretion pathway protein D
LPPPCFVNPFATKIQICLFLLPAVLWSQTITQMEFRSQSVEDILLMLAQVSGVSILTDETVTGRATYSFNDMDLEEALDQFLFRYGYCYEKRNGVYHVSRIDLKEQDGLITLRVEETDLQLVIRRLSRDLGITILHDALPQVPITINFEKGSLENLLDIMIKPYPQFSLERGDNYFYFRKESTPKGSVTGDHSSRGADLFTKQDQLYTADFSQVRFREALTSLMALEEREFSFLGRNDYVIDFFRHEKRDFYGMLSLLMEQGNAAWQESGGIFYVLDLDRQDILKRYFTTVYLPLNYISVDQMNSLIPSSLASSSIMKIDKNNNALLLNGTLQEIGLIQDFVSQIDRPLTDRKYRRYDLQSIKTDDFHKSLSPEMSGIHFVDLDDNSFLAALNDDKHQDLLTYLNLVDRITPVYPVSLAYLEWDTLKENLPPGVESSQLKSSGNPALFFFEGGRRAYETLMDHLSIMDQPRPQIRYEMLVLQVEDSQGLNLDNTFSVNRTDSLSSTGFSGSLSGLTSLTFDVVSQFGYQFAASLSINLTRNKSRVLADTTLHGLSGEKIRFQNTNTSRHPTTAVDGDTGKTEITGFREITSGLIVDMEGWVSGDGMITMDIQSTISSQTSSSSSNSNSIPTTSEKVINTHVRSLSGEPIILSGLKQRETVTEIKKIPFLGDIPLLGLLFQSRTETLKNTEFLITLIPYREEEHQTLSQNPYADLYSRFCQREAP